MPPKKKGAEAVSTDTYCARFGRVKNNLKFGLVGLPNVGKSSLFNLFTEQSAAAENFPFCTIDPNDARCEVPDDRYRYLCDVWKPTNEHPAYLQITDIAGLVKGAAEGKGLGNAFLSHIQAVDGYFHVVRSFEDLDVLHVEEDVNPVRDLGIIQNELCLKDLETLNRCLAQYEMEKKKAGQKNNANANKNFEEILLATFAKCKETLEQNKPIRDAEWSNQEVDIIKEKLYTLITTKPCIYLINLSAKDFIRKKNKWLPKIAEWVKGHGGGKMIPISVEYEQEVWNMREDKTKYDEQMKIARSTIPKAIKTAYHELNLIHFFTAGEKEVRCWSVYKGWLAPQAAGVIHSDFERGFIKAETASFADFKELHNGKSMAPLKEAGKYRLEGKTYVVQDGDIILFQFNVSGGKKK